MWGVWRLKQLQTFLGDGASLKVLIHPCERDSCCSTRVELGGILLGLPREVKLLCVANASGHQWWIDQSPGAVEWCHFQYHIYFSGMLIRCCHECFKYSRWSRAIEAPIWQAMHHFKGCGWMLKDFMSWADLDLNGASHNILGSWIKWRHYWWINSRSCMNAFGYLGPDLSSSRKLTPLRINTSYYCGADLLTCSDCTISIKVSRHLLLKHVFYLVALYLRLRISDVTCAFRIPE